MKKEAKTETKNEITVFGGGCFWCTEAVFLELKGVISVAPGYAGGTKVNPTYENVSSGITGYVEVIRIKFNPKIITYNDLLTVFFASHDPTTLDRQGADVGSQYRSVIFYTTPQQKKAAEKFIAKLNFDHSPKVVTTVQPLSGFFPAEDYHRGYYQNNQNVPYCQIVINPKLEKLKNKFEKLFKRS
ncbi:MAG TPA: peptide-methionine (S)-S-oxide reductase MsrA [Candidatus Paceibacterota bacterium]